MVKFRNRWYLYGVFLLCLLAAVMNGIAHRAGMNDDSMLQNNPSSGSWKSLPNDVPRSNWKSMPQGHAAVLQQLRRNRSGGGRRSNSSFASQWHDVSAMSDIAQEYLQKQQSSRREVVPDLGFVPTDSFSKKYWPEVPEDHYLHLARAFVPFHHSWCVTEKTDIMDNTGLLFVKLPKAASSTLSGVVLRMAHRHGSPGKPCRTQQKHVDAHRYSQRDRSKSFLLGNIRDIASREVSNIFFRYHTKLQQSLTDDKIIDILASGPHLEWLKTGNANVDLGFQLRYLNPFHMDTAVMAAETNDDKSVIQMTLDLVQKRVQQVVQEYDFITVAERLDESLVALQLLLGLDVSDIIYVSSKTSGSYVELPERRKQKCRKIVPNSISPAVGSYLSSTKWYSKNYGDFLLYKTVNASLDMTIEALGRERFNDALANYRDLQQRAQAECSPSTQFPCSSIGVHQPEVAAENCYEKDWGCGYPCLDEKFG